MTCTPPPKSCVDPTTLNFVGELRKRFNFSAPTLARRIAVAQGLSAEAQRIQGGMNEGLHLVCANDLLRHFTVNETARWAGAPSSRQAGPAGLLWQGTGASPSLGPVTEAALRGELAAVRVAKAALAGDVPRLDFAKAVTQAAHVAVAQALGISASTAPFTGSLCDTAMFIASILVHDLKDRLGVPRPDHAATWGTDAVTDPLIPTPDFYAYPGGHAMQLWALHELLATLQATTGHGHLTAKMTEIVEALSEHRREFGVHTQTDNAHGKVLGEWLGQRLVDAAQDATQFPRWAAVWELACAEWPAASAI